MRFFGGQIQSAGERVIVACVALSDASATGIAAVRRDASGVPTAFRLLKPGVCEMTLDGKSVAGEIDAADIQAILDYHALKGEMIPIDCEHLLKLLADARGIDEASLLKNEPLLGEQAAAGSATLVGENGEIWAHIQKLTARARELLSLKGDKAYFYFSPVFRGLSNGPLRVTSIALTNLPAINNLPALAATGERRTVTVVTKTTRGANMKERLLRLLGLLGITDHAALTAEGADLTPVLEKAAGAIEKERGAIARFMAGLKDSLGLTDSDTLETLPGRLLPILEKAKGDATALTALQSRVDGLEAKEKERLIDQLRASGKLTEAMLGWARSIDAAALTSWAKDAGVLVAPTRIVRPEDRPADGTLALSDADRRIASKCGLKLDDVAKVNKLTLGAAAVAVLMFLAGICQAADLTAPRNTAQRTGHYIAMNVASGSVIYAGAIVAVNASGFAVQAGDVAGESVIGRCEHGKNNSGFAYAATNLVTIQRGVFEWDNAGDVTAADIGKIAYVTDSQTVNKTGGGNNVIAGEIVDVDANGVWVDTDHVGIMGSSTPISLAVSGSATVGGTLAVTGSTTVSNLTVNGVTVKYLNLPTATNGLATGTLWNNSGALSVK